MPPGHPGFTFSETSTVLNSKNSGICCFNFILYSPVLQVSDSNHKIRIRKARKITYHPVITTFSVREQFFEIAENNVRDLINLFSDGFT